MDKQEIFELLMTDHQLDDRMVGLIYEYILERTKIEVELEQIRNTLRALSRDMLASRKLQHIKRAMYNYYKIKHEVVEIRDNGKFIMIYYGEE